MVAASHLYFTCGYTEGKNAAPYLGGNLLSSNIEQSYVSWFQHSHKTIHGSLICLLKALI